MQTALKAVMILKIQGTSNQLISSKQNPQSLRGLGVFGGGHLITIYAAHP